MKLDRTKREAWERTLLRERKEWSQVKRDERRGGDTKRRERKRELNSQEQYVGIDVEQVRRSRFEKWNEEEQQLSRT